jgi:hypothetical protein
LLKKALGLVIAAAVPFVFASALLTSSSQNAASRNAQAVEHNETQVAMPDLPSHVIGAGTEDDDSAVDLIGNPVNDAVAKYQFDATGSLYELHSPQTELPRLGSPKS